MDTRSQILRWREIVHPFFWPVFFWNLWKFAHFLRLLIETSGNGLITFGVTWWGAIRIYDVIDPDAPRWDDGLGECANRLHLARLDVGNPYLANRVPLTLQGEGASALTLMISLTIQAFCLRSLDPSLAGRGRRARLALGCFVEPAHLNSS
ncbi:MAG: hypothetical protein AAFQ22_13015 [Pseudomonadota bacterium]